MVKKQSSTGKIARGRVEQDFIMTACEIEYHKGLVHMYSHWGNQEEVDKARSLIHKREMHLQELKEKMR